MGPEPTFSRFAYFDTNVLSELAKQPHMWKPIQEYLFREDLTLALSGQLAELSDASRLHDALSAMFGVMPTALIKPLESVLVEEIAAYPADRIDSLLFFALNGLTLEPDGRSRIKQLLQSPDLQAVRKGQRESAELVQAKHADLKPNFPPTSDGTYQRSQAPLFAFAMTVQWLAAYHGSFLKRFQSEASQFQAETVKSIRIYALVIYYKYYLGRRHPSTLSDFGDLSHLYALPYCSVAVVERDLANVLSQIQRHDPVLQNVEIHDIGFVRRIASRATETTS